MKKYVIVVIVVALFFILGRLLLSYIDKNRAFNAKKRMAIPSVTVLEVKNEDVTRQFEAPARVVAKYRVDVQARISGYLTKSYFKEGDEVKAGQVLFEIEPQEYEYATNKAKANLDNAVSQADYYKKQLQRYEDLVKQDYIAKSEYDNILAQSNAYKAQVESAMSAYRDAQRNLGYTKIKAPVDGRIGIISVTVGNFVNSMSEPLTTINSSNPMYVVFPLESKDFVELVRVDGSANIDRDVEFIFSNGRKYEFNGIQDFHDNKIDETTGTITLRATFNNPKDELIQGDYGKIIIYSKLKDKVPVIPQSSTQENQEGRFVYLLDSQDLPRMVYIKIGGQTLDGKWIVSEGVKEGDRLVTSGLQSLIPGRPVKIIDNSVQNSVPYEKENFIKKVLNKIKNI
ncbi:efflux RND transporter periplasmic adaptor subunit [bacterium]|nr:efflux RND transporter periplasmic adaptor subunit [bacterium]